MEEVAGLIKLYRIYIIDNLFISLLIIKLFSLYFTKNSYSISKNIIRWLIIVCAAAGLLNWVLYIINNPALPERATGYYWWAFWALMFFSDILPFVLLFKKIKAKSWLILIVLLLMSFGRGIEWLVTRGDSGSSESISISFTPLLTLLTGSGMLAIFITGISILVMKYRKTRANDINALQ
jgi:hypothetical protein